MRFQQTLGYLYFSIIINEQILLHKLEVIRAYNNLPKIFSQLYEIKILSLNDCDEQFKLKRPSVKNKSFEIAKKLKDLKLKQNLRMKFRKRKTIY